MKEHSFTLMEILKSTPKQLLDHATGLREDTVVGEDFVFVPGDTRMPLLVAHVDIVHRQLPKVILVDQVKRIMSSPTGIGADDRAGVHAILTLWENLDPKPGLLFCDKEETGGIGAYNASFDIYDQLQEFPFYIEIDRKGHGEAVFYNDERQDFIKFIESFGFKEEYGVFSDITTLGTETKKCSVNLSAGYDGAHTLKETLYLLSLEYTIEHVSHIMLRMLNDPPKGLSFRLPRPPKHEVWGKHTTYYGGGFGGYAEGDLDFPAVDDYMKHESAVNWYNRGTYGKTCDMCDSDAEVQYVNLNYGYLCVECRRWLVEDEKVYAKVGKTHKKGDKT